MAPITNEFSITFSLITSVAKSDASSYIFTVFKMTSSITDDPILTVSLKKIDIFYDQMVINLKGLGDVAISPSC